MSPALLDALPVAILVWRLVDEADEGSLVLGWANRAAPRALGLDLGALAGRRIRDVLPAVKPDQLAALAEVARGGAGCELVLDGGERLSFRAFSLPERSVGLLLREGSTSVERDAELLRVNRFLDSIVEHVPAMIFVKEASELRFELFNRAGEELLGLSRDALLGKTDYDFFPPEQAAFFQAKDREVLNAGKVVDIAEEPIDTATGKRWLHTRKVPIADERGRPAYLLGVSVDITEAREAQAALARANEELDARVRERSAELSKTEHQLRHAQKMDAVGRLAGGVAHDFNNMLSVVLSQTDLILSDLPTGDPLRREIEEIRQAGLRAAELTRQLLAFSRQQVLNPRLIDLNQVVAGVERMLRRLLGADIELTVLTANAPFKVLADPGQIEQVLVNLVVNARDAMPRGGKLTIQTKNAELDEEYAQSHVGVTPGPYAMLAVTDTGQGMDRETQLRIFEPFFTTKEKGKGTGLGLSTVFGIVKQSQGNIWVYSEPGRGTTFRVYLPRAEQTTEDRRSPSPAPTSGRGNETILLVEDEPPVRNVARNILRRHGYTVLEASNPGDALLIVEQHPAKIHLLLTDVVLPRMSGPELAERLTVARPQMRLLFMSGYTDEAMQQHGVLDSGVTFLQKPITPEALLRKVREALARPPRGRGPR